MEEFFEYFTRAVMIESGFKEICSSVGKPLIKEKLDKMKKPKMISVVRANLMIEKIDLEIKPQKPFGEIRESMADIGSGMFKRTLVEGFGETLKENTQVTVQYTIFLENKSSTVYDSSYIPSEPFIFVLGKYRGLLPGFEKAVQTMRNQEKAEFIVPRLMSAEDGKPLTENERSDGYLVIEVIRALDIVPKWEKARVLNNINQMLMQAEELREKGRVAFGAGFYRVALDIYIQGVYMLRLGLAQTPADNKKRLELLMRMCLNTGIVLNKLNQSEYALEVLQQAMEIMDCEEIKTEDTLKGKILLHTARTLRLEGRYLRAYVILKRAKKCLGDVKDIKDELANIFRANDTAMKEDYLVGPMAQVFDLTPEMELHCSKCHNVFQATFDHMVKTFMCSKEQKMIVYGVQDNGHVEMAEAVVAKYKKVRLQVQKKHQTIYYILSKK